VALTNTYLEDDHDESVTSSDHCNSISSWKEVMRKILIADDDGGIRYLLELVLKYRGHQVVTAGSGGEAMNLFRFHRPSVAILDLDMPGIEVMTEVHAVSPDTRIIIFTGADVENVRSQAEQLHAHTIIQKGAPLKGLADLIEVL
jgi:two-component system response regulator (stage 0 sporulation protein F)